jgi:arabinogalactan endo-1,4-beta-galactosidase
VLQEAQKRNLKVVFAIPYGPNDIFQDKQLDQDTYTYVSQIVKKYQGKVSVWQLGNEVASVALNPGGNYMGIDQSDYPEDRYRVVSTWLKAASRAIRTYDPNAKILITDDWVHTGFFDRFVAEGGDFDVLGWDWYSVEGEDINTVTIEGRAAGPYRLMTKLGTYKKPIWLTEVSRHLGSYGENANDREKEQADFIETTAEQAWENQQITGFFVYNLIQDQTLTPNLRAFGILNVDPETHMITSKKQAFDRYRLLIRHYSQ